MILQYIYIGGVEFMSNLLRESITIWDKGSEKYFKEMNDFCQDYKSFISASKTEREAVENIVAIAEANGFIDLAEAIKTNKKLVPGDKIYATHKDKCVVLITLGAEALEQGMNIIGSHLDTPRIDLKQNPLYEEEGFAYLDTHYYGGIKNYQWVTIPLAIHGVIVTEDGKKINVTIGEDEQDPVLFITDLLPHLSKDQYDKKIKEAIEGENLNILVGSIPVEDKEAKSRIKLNILKLLNDKYGITEEDFISAELEIVPSGKARDVGFDRSMVAAYGHDDKICAYTSLRALIEAKAPKKTAVALFVDKEEVGSIGSTGMKSKFFMNTISELINLTEEYSSLKVNRALANSKMLSADVVAAFDPLYPAVHEKKNTSYLGKGIVMVKYTGNGGKGGCNDANAEFLGQVREVFNKNKIIWQTTELGKVDQGGGGTIAYILAEYGMDVVDCGIALLSMHAPWEIASKADIYEGYRAYNSFFSL